MCYNVIDKSRHALNRSPAGSLRKNGHRCSPPLADGHFPDILINLVQEKCPLLRMKTTLKLFLRLSFRNWKEEHIGNQKGFMTQEKRAPRGAQAVFLPSFPFTFSESPFGLFKKSFSTCPSTFPDFSFWSWHHLLQVSFLLSFASPHQQAHIFAWASCSYILRSSYLFFSLVDKNEQKAKRMIFKKRLSAQACFRLSWILPGSSHLMDTALFVPFVSTGEFHYLSHCELFWEDGSQYIWMKHMLNGQKKKKKKFESRYF